MLLKVRKNVEQEGLDLGLGPNRQKERLHLEGQTLVQDLDQGLDQGLDRVQGHVPVNYI